MKTILNLNSNPERLFDNSSDWGIIRKTMFLSPTRSIQWSKNFVVSRYAPLFTGCDSAALPRPSYQPQYGQWPISFQLPYPKREPCLKKSDFAGILTSRHVTKCRPGQCRHGSTRLHSPRPSIFVNGSRGSHEAFDQQFRARGNVVHDASCINGGL
jgi:hypothetical protein